MFVFSDFGFVDREKQPPDSYTTLATCSDVTSRGLCDPTFLSLFG
jgi:hypothetical protein